MGWAGTLATNKVVPPDRWNYGLGGNTCDKQGKAALAQYGLDLPMVLPRYRTCYFMHIWGNGYAAGYYAYLWAEVLEADAFQWFVEHGGMTRDNGMHFRATILSQGGSKPADELYRDFRGRDPEVGPLLEKRGLK